MNDFDLKQWATSWLTKAGVNALEAVIEKREDNDTFAIHISQSLPTHGDQVYHEQLIDLALYDKDCNQRIISDIRILESAETKDAV